LSLSQNEGQARLQVFVPQNKTRKRKLSGCMARLSGEVMRGKYAVRLPRMSFGTGSVVREAARAKPFVVRL
jgi:hypothetical protein